MEMLGPKEKSDFISGDGVYEETWLAPHQWRREVTLASYHAIEVDSNGARKMQSSSDYEPSRVLMLLKALLLPIPRNLASKEFSHEGASGWKIEHITAESTPLVRISRRGGDQEGPGNFTTAFYFLPNGNLVMTNALGLVTIQDGAVPFAGKVVPKHLSIKAGGGERELLEADLVIEAVQPNASPFDLPGSPADPGVTLRPLQFYEVKTPDPHEYSVPNLHTSVFSSQATLDRNGRFREVELISAPNQKDPKIIKTFFDYIRHDHASPPRIDGFPCEYTWSMAVTLSN
jgi:hypothetical protein